MTEKEKQYFEGLTKLRKQGADVLEMTFLKGVKDSVVEKYSDQAHFIYELLQNADDAKATAARFELKRNELLFAHNGSRKFSVSNPDTEDTDTENGTLGDINAITSIANSNKKETSTIGKFGVGFKAVFQYTSAPYIYDDNCCFKIDRFVVPIQLKEDHPERLKGETLFVFPFDHKDRNADQAFKEILNKLKNLTYPNLFLSNLKKVSFKCENTLGLYGKEQMETRIIDGNTNAELLKLSHNNGNETAEDNLWLFSREDEDKNKYCAGFFADEDCHLVPKKKTAFCFFPTKEVTGLNFIIHAPFLLTDSREGIRAGEKHNEAMIELLAELSSDALLCLKSIGEEKNVRIIDDSILDIIPWNQEDFSDPDDMDKVSFMPFYDDIKELFEEECIVPTGTGYAYAHNAYWASVPQIAELFSNEQLSYITENPYAQWAFVTLSRDSEQRSAKTKAAYIDDITYTFLDEKIVIEGRHQGFRPGDSFVRIRGIDEHFIETQDLNWLHQFYKWLSESKQRANLILKKPVFLDTDGNAVPLKDDREDIILFLPVEGVTEYTIINNELLKNPDTKAFLKSLGIKEPDKRDLVNLLITQYENGKATDHLGNFQRFFEYYLSCPRGDIDNYIDDLCGCNFIKASSVQNGVNNCYPDEVYYPSRDLIKYFESRPRTNFIMIQEYYNLVSSNKKDKIKEFFIALGVNTCAKYHIRELDSTTVNKYNLPQPYSTSSCEYEEYYIDGLLEILDEIRRNKSREKSNLLWEELLKVFEKNDPDDISYYLPKGYCHYKYHSSKTRTFDSIALRELTASAWLLNDKGDFCAPKDLFIEQLSDSYDVSSYYARMFVDFLGIKDEASQDDLSNLENLSEKQMNCFQIGEFCKNNGYSLEEVQRLISADLEKRNTHPDHSAKMLSTVPAESSAEFSNGSKFDSADELFDNEDDATRNEIYPSRRRITKTEKRILKKVDSVEEPIKTANVADDDNYDADDFSPKPVDYSKKIQKEEEKLAAKIGIIEHIEELREIVNNSKQYSYGWFKALLELESISSSENNFGNREVSISFAKVEKDTDGKRTLILKHPNTHIPQFIEELADIPLELKYDDQNRKIIIEAASVKSYTLKVKIKADTDIDVLNLSDVREATINAQSPAFLLEELRKSFNALGYEDDFDMKENLPENIKFIFGPPGTGKTTYLANETIIPMMECSRCRVLVLAPTNKAADVIVSRILNSCPESNNWLIRFGATNDEDIEERGILKEKTFDIRKKNKCVVVTTIARFPYDFFMPDSERIFLNGINWDYVVIDEASMITIASIVYPLYKKTPKQFIIAGDPFQIEPIATVDVWKNENIYTMVKLDSFINPQTVPKEYEVKLLTTQYRSIPSVGDIFSKLTYGGILQHYRTEDSQRKLNIEHIIDIGTLNIIKFPVSKYESVYRAKRLNNSSYQIYSALFTFEFVCYLSKTIAMNNNEEFKIGVIAPYKAQTGLIDKLLSSARLPETVDVQVDTVHSFQGDECDIIISVFNTPPSISNNKNMFLNKKNLVNVSISRAKDYLFVVMPDDNTENVNNLRLIKRLEKLCKDTTVCKEFDAHSLEAAMFGDELYLEKNSFSTSHQSVNVYGEPESKYEIRSEDNAVDIQVHQTANDIAEDFAQPKRRATKGNTVVVKDIDAGRETKFILKPVGSEKDIPKAAKMFLGSVVGDIVKITNKSYEILEIV